MPEQARGIGPRCVPDPVPAAGRVLVALALCVAATPVVAVLAGFALGAELRAPFRRRPSGSRGPVGRDPRRP